MTELGILGQSWPFLGGVRKRVTWFETHIALLISGLPVMTGQELPRQFAKDNSRRAIRLGAVTGYKQPEDVRLFIVQRENYVYLVPLEGEHTLFLKTIIPSRKCDEEYLGEDSDHED